MKLKSKFLLAILSTLILGFVGCKKDGAAGGSGGHGKLEVVGGITHDWGEVNVADLKENQLKTSFILKNIGDGDLFIKEVRPGCGCTSAPITKDLLKPGDTTVVNVTLNTTGKHGQTDKSITISASDPVGISKDSLARLNDTLRRQFDSAMAKDTMRYDTTLIYSLKVNLKRSVTLTPGEYFSLVDPKKGVESSATVKISNSGSEAFTISSIEVMKPNAPAPGANGGTPAPTPPKIRTVITGDKTVAPGKEVEVKAYVTPTAVGQISGSITIKTTSKESPVITLPVYGYIQDPSAQAAAQPSAQSSAQPTTGGAKH